MALMRERYLDISKGIGIWCIVLLHFENGFFPSWLNVFISSFMITIFYVVAGFIMAGRPSVRGPKQFFRHRLKQLGIPYLWWSGIIVAFDLLLWTLHYYDGYSVARDVYKIFTLSGIGTLWFLPALFFGEIIWYYIKDKQPWLIISLLALIIICKLAYPHLLGGHSEMAYKLVGKVLKTLDRAYSAVIYIASGYYFGRIFGAWLKKTESMKLIIYGVILWIITYFTACHLHSIVGNADNYLWGYFSPIFGPIALLFMAKALENRRYMKSLEYWGVNSLCLMLIHYSFVLVFFDMIDKYILGFDSYYGARTLLYFILSIPLLYLITKFINAKAKFLLGK